MLSKRFLLMAIVACTVINSYGARLKIYEYPKQISGGQLGTIVFENPDPTNTTSRAQCTAEKLVAWVKSDLPILRIEQNGKQIFTSLGSYMSLGDSVVAVFMAPVILVPGEATLPAPHPPRASALAPSRSKPWKFLTIDPLGLAAGHRFAPD